MAHDIYNLKLHESISFKATSKSSFDTYTVTRVHGGWIYNNLDRNNSVFVPYTIHPNGELDNLEQAGNREIPETSGKSTHEVAESEDWAKVREIADGLTEEQKSGLLKELQKRTH